MELVRLSRRLAREVEGLTFAAPVTHVYNPLGYAAALHEAYLERYGRGPKATILLGMNPGPFGMAQTGIPFGDVSVVRDWMALDAAVGTPARQHPKRPVQGLLCPRAEVSGTRLWGWARTRFGAPADFFDRHGFFVANYCPLVFIEESGRNRTPDKLPAAERAPLFAACDQALLGLVTALRPRHVIGVGAFATRRARLALAGVDVTIGTMLHPSPASPLANKGWVNTVERQLEACGVRLG